MVERIKRNPPPSVRNFWRCLRFLTLFAAKVIIGASNAMKMKTEEFQVETSTGESQASNSDEGQKNPSTLLNEFAGYTTLHGLHFVVGSFSLIRRIIWAVLMLIGMGTLALQCLNGYNKLVENDSSIVKEQERGKTILFPAVTICNQNMLRKDNIMGTEAQKFLDDIESLLFNEGLSNNANKTLHLDLGKVVRQVGHNMTEMLQMCIFQGKVCRPEDFYLIISAQRGLCYTFNSGKPGYQLQYQSSAGRDQGLILQLDAEPDQYYGPFNMLEGTGFRVMVHDQNEWPDIENYGIDISPGFSSTIRIQRCKTMRLPPPYKPKCGERQLASTDNYSYSACVMECWTRIMIDRCQCKTLGMVELAGYESFRYCGPKEYVKCIMQRDTEFTVDSDCDCPIKCETVSFNYQLSSSSFPSRHVLPILVKRINASAAVNGSKEFYDKIQTELRTRLLQLNIFYQSVVTEVAKEKPAYDIHDFGSDIGGNMGLFLGCSLLTLCEFVDLFILICLRDCRTGRKVQVSQ